MPGHSALSCATAGSDFTAVHAQKAEHAASSKQVVTKKFRRKPLDPDERYAQERAQMEAAQAQRAAQVCSPPAAAFNSRRLVQGCQQI